MARSIIGAVEDVHFSLK